MAEEGNFKSCISCKHCSAISAIPTEITDTSCAYECRFDISTLPIPAGFVSYPTVIFNVYHADELAQNCPQYTPAPSYV